MLYEIDRDYVRAIQCYQQAVALGDEDAKVDIMRVRVKIGPEIMLRRDNTF